MVEYKSATKKLVRACIKKRGMNNFAFDSNAFIAQDTFRQTKEVVNGVAIFAIFYLEAIILKNCGQKY